MMPIVWYTQVMINIKLSMYDTVSCRYANMLLETEFGIF